MVRAKAVSRRSLLRGSAAALAGSVGAATLAACGEAEVIEKIVTVTEIKEVVKEVPVETVVTKEVIKEVVKEVPVEVIKEVPVEKIVIQEVPVEKVVIKEVPVETIKEVPVEKIVVKEVVVEKVVTKEVFIEKIVERTPTPEPSPAPEPTAAVAERPMLAEGRNMEATGFMPSSFQEAPSLAARVAAGELPPVEERLPSEPLVWQPWEAIGTYGGRLNFASVAISVDIGNANRTDTLAYDMTGTVLVNDAVKHHEVSSDGTTVVLELRKGHKWSDGAPFTSENFLWHYHNYMLHAELQPRGPWPPINGKPPKVEAPDEVTVEISYPDPAPIFLDRLGRGGSERGFYIASHYIEQFHADFNPEAERLARREGFDDWTERFRAKMRWGAHQTWFTWHAVDRPVLAPWMLTAHSPDRASLDRNPYFHIVDTAGNQLPYVEGLNFELLSDREVYQIRLTQGSLDFGQFELDFNNMPLYRDYETRGNYRTLISKALRSSALALQPNWTYKDAAVAEIFQELDFRIALSVAIDREFINDVVYFGLATPFQGTILPSYTFYEDHWGTIHTEYDPAKANELLDGLGLDQRDAQGWRLRPDGERLTLVMEIGDQEGPKDAIAELVAENWRDVGLDARWIQMERPLYEERLNLLTEIMIGTEHTEATGYFTRWVPWVWGYKGIRAVWAGGWTAWFATNGGWGPEPPDEIKANAEAKWRWQLSVPGTPDYDRWGKEYFGWQAENLTVIGTVGFAPHPTIVNNRVKNFPDDEENLWFGAGANFTKPYRAFQWFIPDA